MEFGRFKLGNGLRQLADKHNFSPTEEKCTLKLLSYIEKSKEFKSDKKIESVLTEVLKMYLLELCFRRKFFGILKYQKSVFIERDLIDLPEEIKSLNELLILSDSLQEKTNPIRRKIIFSKTFLPNDVLKLLSE